MLGFNRTVSTSVRMWLAIIPFAALCAAAFWLLQGDSRPAPTAKDKNAATLILEENEKGGSPILRGSLNGFSAERGDSLAEVDSKRVYLAIPAYQTINQEKIRRGSARWAQLMREATFAYRKVLEQASRNTNSVLVVEKGSTNRIPEIPAGYPAQDITQACIAAL